MQIASSGRIGNKYILVPSAPCIHANCFEIGAPDVQSYMILLLHVFMQIASYADSGQTGVILTSAPCIHANCFFCYFVKMGGELIFCSMYSCKLLRNLLGYMTEGYKLLLHVFMQIASNTVVVEFKVSELLLHVFMQIASG